MVLPHVVDFCDALELAAIAFGQTLFDKDIAKQFFPSKDLSDCEADLRDVFAIANLRSAAVGDAYPFVVTERSIVFKGGGRFNCYLFQLLGSRLKFGGPKNVKELQSSFRRYFEDIVCWSLKRSGFFAEVLSEPRVYRGLSMQLAPALRELSTRFGELAVLREDRLVPGDNDLDVDVVAVPICGNSSRPGWPAFGIQCATGSISNLQAKLQEGSHTFSTVWNGGFFSACMVRAIATPDDLLKLDDVYWSRLGSAGWVLDRTRIAYLGAGSTKVEMLKEVSDFWKELWAARKDINWQGG